MDQEVIYFLTFCVADRQPVLAQDAVLTVLHTAVLRLDHWWVYAAILMPDHVHILAGPDQRELDVGRLAGALKRWIRRGVSANWQWQTGSFDRLLRADESVQAKWEYMRDNPVRARLVKRWEDWPFSIGFRQNL